MPKIMLFDFLQSLPFTEMGKLFMDALYFFLFHAWNQTNLVIEIFIFLMAMEWMFMCLFFSKKHPFGTTPFSRTWKCMLHLSKCP
jgi:hypothetical protein